MKRMQSVPDAGQVLVVGTTADYIGWIRDARPGQALFLTAPDIRENATEPCPDAHEEILCDIQDVDGARRALKQHMDTWGTRVTGVACFDCESMQTASQLAHDLGLPYPALAAVQNSRDKFVSKQVWQAADIPCPKAMVIQDKPALSDFLSRVPDGLVLKPVRGSGSELVFRCRTQSECDKAYETMTFELDQRKKNPLFSSGVDAGLIVAEEWISGTEFSCDFIMDQGRARILRHTRKIKMKHQPFGTISGYALCTAPERKTPDLPDLLSRAARALGIETGICMVDYFIRDGQPVFIEMTPRPGGDCLPALLRRASGVDIIGLTLDIAAGRPLPQHPFNVKPYIGLRIHARKGGILKRINTDALKADPRVLQIDLTRRPGHMITMPPKDYDSWLLGHMILAPDSIAYPETECMLLSKRIDIDIQEAC